MLKSYLYLQQTSEMGRGVFTRKSISEGVIIEVSPVVVMKIADKEHLDKTLLHDYIFIWGTQQDQCCMALGFVPMYNHSYKSNCEYIMDYTEDSIIIKTVRMIEKGEELTINYNGDWNDETKIWFDAK